MSSLKLAQVINHWCFRFVVIVCEQSSLALSDQLVKGDVCKTNKDNSYFVYKICLNISHLKYFQIVLFNLSSRNKVVAS